MTGINRVFTRFTSAQIVAGVCIGLMLDAGVITLVLSLFVVVATGALLALLLGAPIPKFLLSDSMRIEERSEELNYAAIALLGLLVSLGLIGSVAALWRIIFRKRNKLLVKIMIVIVIGIVAAYYIGQLLVLMGWL